MKTIRSTGSHQVISAPTSQFRACLTDGIVAKLGNKGADLWVYLANPPMPITLRKRGYFSGSSDHWRDSPVSLEEQAELKNTLIPELKQKLRIAEQRLQNATSYAVARLWAQKAWEMKHDQE